MNTNISSQTGSLLFNSHVIVLFTQMSIINMPTLQRRSHRSWKGFTECLKIKLYIKNSLMLQISATRVEVYRLSPSSARLSSFYSGCTQIRRRGAGRRQFDDFALNSCLLPGVHQVHLDYTGPVCA